MKSTEEREKQIKDIAEKFYLNEEQPLSDDMEKYRAFIRGAELANKNPSDALIMRILNCIGYEDEGWIDFVRKELEKRKDK